MYLKCVLPLSNALSELGEVSVNVRKIRPVRRTEGQFLREKERIT